MPTLEDKEQQSPSLSNKSKDNYQPQEVSLKQQERTDKGKKDKQRTIMEAASALTTLGGEQEKETTITTKKDEKPEDTEEKKVESDEAMAKASSAKRFIPEHKKPDAALTFPEKLMNLMKFAEAQNEENYCVAWLEDGKSFIIRNPDEFTRKVLPKFFKATKFSSFTRKLYRWGFRQVNRGIGPDDPIIFGNEFFQRDAEELMTKMRSITAASTRKAEANTIPMHMQMGAFGNKRPLQSMESDPDPKRLLLDQLLQQKSASAFPAHSLYGAHASGAMNLTSALRPNLGASGFGLGMAGAGVGLKPFEILGQSMTQTNPLLNAFQMQSHALNPPSNSNGLNNARGQQFPTAASTAEIVNAAINALRFAS